MHASMTVTVQNTHTGPGGRGCPCCTAFGPKGRKTERRIVKRRDRQAFKVAVRRGEF